MSFKFQALHMEFTPQNRFELNIFGKARGKTDTKIFKLDN